MKACLALQCEGTVWRAPIMPRINDCSPVHAPLSFSLALIGAREELHAFTAYLLANAATRPVSSALAEACVTTTAASGGISEVRRALNLAAEFQVGSCDRKRAR